MTSACIPPTFPLKSGLTGRRDWPSEQLPYALMDSSYTHFETLGLIAGNRTLPLIFARQARAMGVRRLVAVGFEGETRPELRQWVDELVWLKVGQLVKMIEALKSRGVTHCVMAGQITPKRLFDLRPDFRTVSILFRLKEKNAQTLFGAVVEELDKEGIHVLDATPWLKPIMAPEGFRLGPEPSTDQGHDLTYGFRLAKEISRLEIGQLVVVKGGTILAVEAFEGTDACLRRGGELAGKDGGAVAVKVAKEKHDFRFDIPCVGLETLDVCARSGISALGLEVGRTLVLDQDEVGRMAIERRISVVACSDRSPSQGSPA